MSKTINVGIIGAGRMGKVHGHNLVRSIPDAKLVAVHDIQPEIAQTTARELGGVRVARDQQEIFADQNIDAVIITSATDTHATIIQAAAQAGKHIFCEKPLALDLPTIDATLAAVQRTNVKLQVGFNRRFDTSFKRVHDLVNSGDLGRPCILRITSRDPQPPSLDYARVSGGIFLDMTIHDFDMARFQMGDVVEVYATGGVLVAPQLAQVNDIDTTLITLKFANGAMGVIDNSRQAAYGYDQRLEVHCENGMALADNQLDDTVVQANKNGYSSSRLPNFFMNRYAPCYVEELRQFVECVRDDKPVPVDGNDGRMAVILGHAAWKSYRENRPVKVSEIG